MYACLMNPPVFMHVLWISCMYACFMNSSVCVHVSWIPLYVCMFYESPCMYACFINSSVCTHVWWIPLYKCMFCEFTCMYAVFMNSLYVCMFYESPVCMHVLWIPCMYACFMNPPVCMHVLWILLYAYKSEVISSNWSYVNFNFQVYSRWADVQYIICLYKDIYLLYKVVISFCLSDHNSSTTGPIWLTFWLGNFGGSREEWVCRL